MTIRLLDPDVAAKIAAGEVVERPSSVVKELVENSLDAGASKITVEVKGGGIERLRVVDDGCGIPADQVELAFQRHATSKIQLADQLDAIDTLGFRGEALPSIAAVARVSLTTRTEHSAIGHEVKLSWGEVTGNRSTGCPVGTSILVEGMFENLPARRKFLRTPSGEKSRLSDVISRYALAFPEVAFRLQMDEKNTLTTLGNGNLGDAVISVYGAETAQSMLEVIWEGSGDGYGVSGFVGAPSIHRSNRTYVTFLVNRRWIQSNLLSAALSETYRGFLPDRRHPVAVVNLAVPVGEVDVNVHPAKREVRFRQENRIFSSLQRAVRGTLISVAPVPELRIPGPQMPTTGAHAPAWGPLASATNSLHSLPSRMSQGASLTASNQTFVEGMSGLRFVGQIKNTYLVAEGSEGMFLIDQHAAHERVLYEKVSREVAARIPQMQALLDPILVELSPQQEEAVQANTDLLTTYGYLLEPFGDRTYLIRALPLVVEPTMGTGSPGKSFLEVLDMSVYEGMLRDRDEALAASIACHSAVRAGMTMNQDQMESLVRQLESCDSPHTCPHGRPTMIHLSSYHLEREFGRKK